VGCRDTQRTKGDRPIYVDRLGTKAAYQLINTVIGRNQLTGDSKFIDDIETRIGIRVEFRGRGKPGKVKK
jgi:putative transposase